VIRDENFELAGQFLLSKGFHMTSKLDAWEVRELLTQFAETSKETISKNFSAWLHSLTIPVNGEDND
jgi:hypothetical protein